jgi:hypothetical protein
MPKLTELKTSGDLMIHEVEYRYTRVGVPLTNPTLGTVNLPDPVGYPVKNNAGDWELLVAGDEDNVSGLIYSGPPIVGLETTETTSALKVNGYAIVVDGPTLIKRSGLATVDVEDAAFDVDALVAALEGINIKTLNVPENQSLQTD